LGSARRRSTAGSSRPGPRDGGRPSRRGAARRGGWMARSWTSCAPWWQRRTPRRWRNMPIGWPSAPERGQAARPCAGRSSGWAWCAKNLPGRGAGPRRPRSGAGGMARRAGPGRPRASGLPRRERDRHTADADACPGGEGQASARHGPLGPLEAPDRDRRFGARRGDRLHEHCGGDQHRGVQGLRRAGANAGVARPPGCHCRDGQSRRPQGRGGPKGLGRGQDRLPLPACLFARPQPDRTLLVEAQVPAASQGRTNPRCARHRARPGARHRHGPRCPRLVPPLRLRHSQRNRKLL